MTTGLAIADPVIVGWQIRDLQSFPSSYASSLAKMIGVQETPAPGSSSTFPLVTGQPGAESTTSPPPPPSQTPTPSPSLASSGLSSGVKAGIAMGVLANVAIFGAVLAFFLGRRSKKKKNTASPSSRADEAHEISQAGEKSGASFSSVTWTDSPISPTTMARHELEGDRELQELGGGKEIRRKRSELDSKAVRVFSGAPIEMDASNHDHIRRSEKPLTTKAEKQIF